MEYPEKTNYQNYYHNYWDGQYDHRAKTNYLETRYDSYKSFFAGMNFNKCIDVGGGNGYLMKYLNVESPVILDISFSGLKFSKHHFHFQSILGNLQSPFPIKPNSFNTAFIFEVLEHLHFGNRTLCEIYTSLVPNGILYISQPSMGPDGMLHVRQYFFKDLKNDLEKCGFEILQVDFIPAFHYRSVFRKELLESKSLIKKIMWGSVLGLSYVPLSFWKGICKLIPNTRFSSLCLIKARKKTSESTIID